MATSARVARGILTLRGSVVAARVALTPQCSTRVLLRPLGSSTDLPPSSTVRLPDVGKGKAAIRKWYKEVGEVVEEGDNMCHVEFEDVEFDLGTEYAGFVAAITQPATEDYAVDAGSALALIVKEQEHVALFQPKDEN